MRAVRLLISGKVQGVGYRDWARREAATLGLAGWVRNLRDGRVEALACGEEDAISALIKALRRGPTMARVEEVESLPADPVSGPGFEIRPTA